jgi:hypothetical protein
MVVSSTFHYKHRVHCCQICIWQYLFGVVRHLATRCPFYSVSHAKYDRGTNKRERFMCTVWLFAVVARCSSCCQCDECDSTCMMCFAANSMVLLAISSRSCCLPLRMRLGSCYRLSPCCTAIAASDTTAKCYFSAASTGAAASQTLLVLACSSNSSTGTHSWCSIADRGQQCSVPGLRQMTIYTQRTTPLHAYVQCIGSGAVCCCNVVT